MSRSSNSKRETGGRDSDAIHDAGGVRGEPGAAAQALMDAIGKMAEEATKAGLMLQSGGLAPTAMSSRVGLSRES